MHLWKRAKTLFLRERCKINCLLHQLEGFEERLIVANSLVESSPEDAHEVVCSTDWHVKLKSIQDELIYADENRYRQLIRSIRALDRMIHVVEYAHSVHRMKRALRILECRIEKVKKFAV